MLASSPTKQGIVKLVNKFYFSNDYTIKETQLNPDEFIVFNSKGNPVHGVRVKKVRNRYHFYICDEP